MQVPVTLHSSLGIRRPNCKFLTLDRNLVEKKCRSNATAEGRT
jgi:hypothetical protein